MYQFPEMGTNSKRNDRVEQRCLPLPTKREQGKSGGEEERGRSVSRGGISRRPFAQRTHTEDDAEDGER